MSEPEPERSSRWMSQAFHALLVAVLLIVVGYRVYVYFAMSETEIADSKKPPITSQSLRQLRATANEAFRREDWKVAAEAYSRVTEKEASNVRARVCLAHALHHSGQHDEALAEFLAICRFEGRVRRWALYNIACVYALKGDKRMALDYLSESAEEGFRTENPIMEDPDLVSLLDEPEFKLLAEMFKPVAQRDVYRRFDFLIGRWNLVTEDDQKIGSLVVEKKGLTLLGEYTPESNSPLTTLVAFYDPEISDWRQWWLDKRGPVIQLQGDSAQDGSLVLSGHQVAADGEKILARAIYTDAEGGIVHLELATSNDEGATWLKLIDATMLPPQASEQDSEAGP